MKARVILLAVLLTGCAKPPPIAWRADGEQQQFKQDNYQCVQESRTSWSGGGSGVIGPIMIAGARRDAEAESRRLYIMCMEAHGYTQAKAGGPYLGLNVRPDEQGLRINRIVTGGPAEAAGLLVDDVIRESDGRRVTGLNDFYATLDAKMPGDQMTLLVLRAGAAREVTVTVGRRP